MRPTLLFYAKVICCTISNCFKFLTLRWCFVFFLYVSCYLKKMNVSHFRWKTFWQKSDSICPSPHQIQPRPQLWILIGNNKVAATLRTLIHSHLRSERSRCVFHALETTTTTKRVECSNTGSLRGLLVRLPWIRTHTETRHAIFFYLFSSPVFWFCIIKLMTCQLTEVGLFFFFFSARLWLCVSCIQEWARCLYVCMCRRSFPYAFGCLCVRVGFAFLLTRACALNTVMALGSMRSALFALLTQGISYKLLTLPHLLISLPSIYLCLQRSIPLPQQQTLKRQKSPCLFFHNATYQADNSRKETSWIRLYTLLRYCCSLCSSDS